MDTANTFGNMKPDMKDTYAGKNKRFQKLKSVVGEKPKKECDCESKKQKCSCKK